MFVRKVHKLHGATSFLADRKPMKKVLLFMVFMVIAGGIVWYENKPTTVTIPVRTSQETPILSLQEEPTVVTQKTTTTEQSATASADFSKINVHLEVEGASGDDVILEEMVHQPQHLNDLPADVSRVVTGCDGVTDRDMAVRVDVRLQLTSSLPAEVHVDYQTDGFMTVFDFRDGLSCQYDGNAEHHLQPDEYNQMSYWVVLRGMVTPNSPDGDISQSWHIPGPTVMLPNSQNTYWKMWGDNVAKCDNLLGDAGRIWLGGASLATIDGCQPATQPSQALGNI